MFLIVAITLLLFGHAARAVAIGFTGPANYRVGNTPIAAATGDFNGDDKPDLAVANSGDSTVTILLGTCTGTFQSTVRPYPVPQSPRALAVGDFNGDDFVDIVVTAAGSIAVLRGKGDGTFGAPITSTGDDEFSGLAVRDLNLDGRLDLAVTDGKNVSVLLGKGDGTFQAPVNYSIVGLFSGIQGTAWSVAVAAADLNDDDRPDLAVAVSYYVNSVYLGGHIRILLGNGDGTFKSGVNYGVGGRPNSLVVDDFNHDGVPDVAVTVTFATVVPYETKLLLGNANGTLKAPVTVDPRSADLWLVAADFDGDGNLDLAAGSYWFSSVGGLYVPSIRVLLGNGGGSFQGARSFWLKAPINSVTVEDFNSDGLPDLVVTTPSNNAIGRLLNTSGSTGADLASNLFGGGTVEAPRYTVAVNNRGPEDATGVLLTDTLPNNVTFVSATPSQGTCSLSGLKVVCDFGSLPAGGLGFIRINIIAPAAPYEITNSATVTADQFDPNRNNNTSQLTSVTDPPPVLTVTSVTPSFTGGMTGTPMTWSTTAVYGIKPYTFQFWVYDGTQWRLGRDWSLSSTWTWTPSAPGTYSFQVWVRNAGSSARLDAFRSFGPYVATSPPALSVDSLTADRAASVPAGTPVTWTAVASGGVGPYTYQFWVFNGTTWNIGQGWSASPTWMWVPSAPGNYMFQVWVRNVGSTARVDAYRSAGPYTVGSPATLTVTRLVADRTSPVPQGTPVTWTVVPSGGTGPYTYEFWVFNGTTWNIGRDWSPSPTWMWIPSAPGNYVFQVWVRNAGSTARFDAYRAFGPYTVGNPAPLTVTRLAADRVFPIAPGTPVTWTAMASGGTGPYTYKFWVFDGTTWNIGQDWSVSPTWMWIPSASSTCMFQVWIRNVGSTASFDAYRSAGPIIIGSAAPFAVTSTR